MLDNVERQVTAEEKIVQGRKQDEEQDKRGLRFHEIKKIVTGRLQRVWMESGVPVGMAVIDQELETAARDVIDLVRGGDRDKEDNPYPGELLGVNAQWYIPRPLTIDEYQRHRTNTDSNHGELSGFPKVRFASNRQQTWGVRIDGYDNPRYPIRREKAIAMARAFQRCGFPLTQETAQRYLLSTPDKATAKLADL